MVFANGVEDVAGSVRGAPVAETGGSRSDRYGLDLGAVEVGGQVRSSKEDEDICEGGGVPFQARRTGR